MYMYIYIYTHAPIYPYMCTGTEVWHASDCKHDQPLKHYSSHFLLLIFQVTHVTGNVLVPPTATSANVPTTSLVSSALETGAWALPHFWGKNPLCHLCETLASGPILVTAFSHAENPSKRHWQGHVEGQSSTVWCTSPSMASGFPAVIAILIPCANGSSCLRIIHTSHHPTDLGWSDQLSFQHLGCHPDAAPLRPPVFDRMDQEDKIRRKEIQLDNKFDLFLRCDQKRLELIL